MLDKDKLSGLGVTTARGLTLIAGLFIVIAVAFLCLSTLPTPAHSQGRRQSPSVGPRIADTITVPNGSSACFQYANGDEGPWREWTMATHPGSTNIVGPRQVNAVGKSLAPNVPSGNEGLIDVADYAVSGFARPLSNSGSYTMYLPIAMHCYALPLCNGDFEVTASDFAPCWERGGALSASIATTLSNGDTCYSGMHCALLGSPDYPCNKIPLGYSGTCQTFAVPLTGTPKLSFHYRIFSYDEFGGGRFDSFQVCIDDACSEAPPILLLEDGSKDGKYGCDKLDITGWKHAVFDLSAVSDESGGTVDYRGRTIQLCFYVYSRERPEYDVAWYNTWVYVDDVQIREGP